MRVGGGGINRDILLAAYPSGSPEEAVEEAAEDEDRLARRCLLDKLDDFTSPPPFAPPLDVLLCSSAITRRRL